MPYGRYKHKRFPLTKDESNRIVNACSTFREKLVIWGLLDSGLRIEEFCTIDQNNINWQDSKMVVFGKGMANQGKKRRTIPLTHRFKVLLETYFATTDEKVGLGMTPRTANRIVKKVANAARISKKCCPHVLRHTFAVTSLDNGVPLPALQQVLGHEDLATTAIYLNLTNEEAVRMYQDRGYR